MAKVRQDAWSHEDDLLLAETVLRHIREGSTQLKAFDEVGDKLNRTSAACGFRWNAEVRQSYEQAVQIAKKQRKDRKRALANKEQNTTTTTTNLHLPEEEEVFDNSSQEDSFIWNWKKEETKPAMQDVAPQSSLDLSQVIRYLQFLKKEQQQMKYSQSNMERLIQEKEQLQTQLETHRKRVQELEQELQTMHEDYQAFMQIVERARKMVVFDEEQPRPVPKFRMDKNGNLEQVAK
ncbi:RsfA family transcriptional regulator [Gracilibacillus dipsosauri]|uniref:RsfA family transcriptional regulator n=1 Tax=Gracilibacillus dipsosauri TaxID=178340 RepID=A0A317KXY3_9BACI|nr:RsfA family transcriptional regulator [Gracilibacillus dipsosauri]PWU68381.1 RsfA family transcriptional regulator [Gracilibacillus dipsosauri]